MQGFIDMSKRNSRLVFSVAAALFALPVPISAAEPQIEEQLIPVLDSARGAVIAPIWMDREPKLDELVNVSVADGSEHNINAIAELGIHVAKKFGPYGLSGIVLDISEAKNPPTGKLTVDAATQLALMYYQVTRSPMPIPPLTVEIVSGTRKVPEQLREIRWSGVTAKPTRERENAWTLPDVWLPLLWKDYALELRQFPVLNVEDPQSNDGIIAIMNSPVYLPVSNPKLRQRDSNIATRYGIVIREDPPMLIGSDIVIDLTEAKVPEGCVFSLEDAVRAVILAFRMTVPPTYGLYRDIKIVGGDSSVNWKLLEGPLWLRSDGERQLNSEKASERGQK